MTTSNVDQVDQSDDRLEKTDGASETTTEKTASTVPNGPRNRPTAGEGLQRLAQFVQGERRAGEGPVVTGIKHLSQDNLPDLLDVATNPVNTAKFVSNFPDLVVELMEGNLYKPGGGTISAELSNSAGTTRSGAFHGSSKGVPAKTELARNLAVGHLERGGKAVQWGDGNISFIGDQDESKFLSMGAVLLTQNERGRLLEDIKAGGTLDPDYRTVVNEAEQKEGSIQPSSEMARAGGGENTFRVFNFSAAEVERMVQAINPARERDVLQYIRSFRCRAGESKSQCIDRMIRLGKERFKS